MEVIKLKNNRFKTNNYIVIQGSSAILIDATEEVNSVKTILDEKNAKLKAILITHSHFDHILKLNELINEFGCNVYVSKSGIESLYDANKNLSAIYGDEPFIIGNKDKIISFSKNQIIKVDDFNIEIFLTPGHSSCSVCYGIEDFLFTGDTIFKVCIGRNDLWHSSVVEQQKSLNFLKSLKQYEKYYPGHGGDFTYDYLMKVINNNLK